MGLGIRLLARSRCCCKGVTSDALLYFYYEDNLSYLKNNKDGGSF
jgi:hypothetical protein